MIRTNDNVFYLTSGNACYIFKAVNGKLVHMYFGKRIEPEDDVCALLGETGTVEFDGDCIEAERGGKPVSLTLEFCGATVTERPPASDRRGGKTLAVTLGDRVNGITVELYYMPCSRGGFVRGVALKNIGDGDIAVKRVSLPLFVHGTYKKIILPSDEDGLPGFAAIAAAARHADDSYGFLAEFSSAEIEAKQSVQAGGTVVDVSERVQTVIKSGGTFTAAECLFVYSDNGLGGMSRVFHDIVRDDMHVSAPSERKRTVMFCSATTQKISCAAQLAYELGFDIVAADAGMLSSAELKRFADECKTVGINIGLKLPVYSIKKDSALFDSSYVGKDGTFDIFSDNGMSAYVSAVSAITEYTKATYMMLDHEQGVSLRAVDALKAELTAHISEKHKDVVLECGMLAPEDGYSRLRCYPPAVMRNVVRIGKGELKREFDLATFGGLGYEIDPEKIDDKTKLAVRAQILSYQDDASTVIYGDLYRVRTPFGTCRIAVTKDKSKAYAVFEAVKDCSGVRIKLVGTDEHNLYRVREMDKTFSGSALAACGVPVPDIKAGTTVAWHLRQVADFD